MIPLAASLAGWPLLVVGFALGSCVGSFLNVCIHRLPAEESVVWPRSRCPHCTAPIAWYDNLPLLSWLWLGARCRRCRGRISVRYPLVEAATGALAVLALATFGPTPRALVVFAFTAALLLVTAIDLDHLFIPDEVSLPGILLGLGAALLPDGIGLADAVLGVVLGGGILWAIAWGYERLTRVEGMGFGDVKLLAMIGAFLGWQAIPAVLVIASVSGTLVGLGTMIARSPGRASRRVVARFGLRALLPHLQRTARRTAIPFGPFLALGALVATYMPAAVPHSWP
jgi:leader peptidase (prepilin peptidase)/N-methyltransferase